MNRQTAKDLTDLLHLLPPPLRRHSSRVAACSAIMAEHAGRFIRSSDTPSGSSLMAIAHTAGICHDIGKLLIPTLNVQETAYLRHPAMGAGLLRRYQETLFSSKKQTQMFLDIVRYHHERPNGRGFPDGLHTRDIPLMAGLCSIANELDHRLGSTESASDVFNEMKLLEGSLFCETAMVCFERAWPQLIEQYRKIGYSRIRVSDK